MIESPDVLRSSLTGRRDRAGRRGLVVTAALVLLVLARAAIGAERVILKIGHPPHSFTLQDLEGRMVTPADFKGKAVVMYFWADWCTY